MNPLEGGEERNETFKISQCIKEMEKLAKENGFALSPFCSWTPKDWEDKSEEYDEIRKFLEDQKIDF